MRKALDCSRPALFQNWLLEHQVGAHLPRPFFFPSSLSRFKVPKVN